jgi:hypothetical protein
MSETDDTAQPDVTPLDFLRAVYCNEGVPLATRMKAAVECLQYVHPKLAVTVDASRDFASRMEEIARQRGMSNVIDSKANHTLPIQTDPVSDGLKR